MTGRTPKPESRSQSKYHSPMTKSSHRRGSGDISSLDAVPTSLHSSRIDPFDFQKSQVMAIPTLIAPLTHRA